MQNETQPNSTAPRVADHERQSQMASAPSGAHDAPTAESSPCKSSDREKRNAQDVADLVIRVTEKEILYRSMHPYYRGNVVSALGDLIAEKAGVNIGLESESFVGELNRIAETLGATTYRGRIDPETMDRIYTFAFA